MLRRGVFLRAQLLAHGDQIAPGVGLVGELPGLVPFAAVFAAAAHIGVADDGAGIDQRQGAAGEGRRIGGNAVGAVGGDPGGRAAVELQALAVNQRVGNFRAVLGGGEEALGFVGADVDGGLRRDAGVGDAAGGVHGVDARGGEPAGEATSGRHPRCCGVDANRWCLRRAVRYRRRCRRVRGVAGG